MSIIGFLRYVNVMCEAQHAFRGFYMSDYEFIKMSYGKNDSMQGFSEHLIVFPQRRVEEKRYIFEALSSIFKFCHNEFNNFNNFCARMQDSINHMTLKWHFICEFCSKRDFYSTSINGTTFLRTDAFYNVHRAVSTQFAYLLHMWITEIQSMNLLHSQTRLHIM